MAAWKILNLKPSARSSTPACASNAPYSRGSSSQQRIKDEQKSPKILCKLAHNSRRATQGQERGCGCRCLASEVNAEVEEAPERATDIKFVDERRPKSNLLLTFTVPASRCRKAWDKALKVCAKSLDVPGFRSGKKIPESVILRECGKEKVTTEAITRVMDACFGLIQEKYKEQAFGESIQILTEEELLKSFSKDRPFEFQASMDLHPTLSWTGDYKALRVEVPDVSNEEADQEAAKEKLWAALKQKGNLRVADHGVEKGDVAIIDFSARRTDTGDVIAGSEKKGMQVDTMSEDAIFGIEGMVEALVGKRPGDTVRGTFEVSDTWWEQEGRTASLDCTAEIKEVLTWDVPELTDELAKELLPDCAGVDDLWSIMIQAQRQLSKADLAHNVQQALVEAVANIVDCEVPEFMMFNTASSEYSSRLLEYQSSGKLDQEALERLATEELLAEFMEKYYGELEMMQKGILGIEAIFQQEGMSVPEEEMRQEAEKAIQEAKEAQQELDEERLMAQIHEVLKANKVMEFLVDISNIEIIKPDAPVEIAATPEAAPFTAST